MRLAGKTAVVTGGAKGIGKAIVAEFVKEGCYVYLADTDAIAAEAAVEEIGSQCVYVPLDVTDEKAWLDLASHMVPDILVNNAGAVLDFGPLHDTSLEQWNRIIELNLTSVFLGIRTFAPKMAHRGRGSIINMSSISGVVGHSVAAAYQAAKGGVRVLTKNAAMTYVDQGVRVNSIHPGIIETPMVRAQPSWATEGFLAGTPMKRLGRPEEVAFAAVYLASDEAAFVTGTELYVDGGFVAQ